MGNKYEVGYGKPPKSGQFKKGQSGNPKGRPKNVVSLADTIQKSLAKKISVNTPHGIKKVDKLTALIDKTTNEALKGDARARADILRLLKELNLEEATKLKAQEQVQNLDENDLKILARFQKDHN